MDVALAYALMNAQVGRLQLAVAARMLHMNSDAAASAIGVIEAAQHNFDRLANVAAGIGANLDVSV